MSDKTSISNGKPSLPSEVLAFASSLGANLRQARVARGWSQQEMAERLVLSVPTIHAIESGSVKVSLENYLRVLDLMNMANQIAMVASPHTDEEGYRRALIGRVRK